jgi:hypothetical protein
MESGLVGVSVVVAGKPGVDDIRGKRRAANSAQTEKVDLFFIFAPPETVPQASVGPRAWMVQMDEHGLFAQDAPNGMDER